MRRLDLLRFLMSSILRTLYHVSLDLSTPFDISFRKTLKYRLTKGYFKMSAKFSCLTHFISGAYTT